MKLQNSIKMPEYLHEIERVSVLLASLESELKTNRQRMLVQIVGDRSFCLASLPESEHWGAPIVLSNQQDIDNAIPFSKAETLLGTECTMLVYDLFSGINVDVLCLSAGLVKSAGILVLISPDDMSEIDDPYGVWQSQQNSSSRFTDYFTEQCRQMITFRQNGCHEGLHTLITPSAMTDIVDGQTTEQQALLAQMKTWFVDKAKPVFLLTADRGRGKSTALGLFARAIQNDSIVTVTAYSRNQVAILLKQVLGESRIKFVSPDELIRRNEQMNCLLIDEAAMLPLNMLQQLITLSKKTVLATTTGGYEGTGQGFLVKFLTSMDEKSYQHSKLNLPVRWGQQDKLEAWMNRVLLFTHPKDKEGISTGKIDLSILDKDQFFSDHELLHSVYALLVSAHYRTRPSDLRQIMDDNSQFVIIAHQQKKIIGVLLLNQEGGFEEQLGDDIFLGVRRPKGHLLAQMITAQAGVKQFSSYRGLRVQRIAVIDDYRRQGVGRLLIDEANELVRRKKLDYLGSSFALDHAVTPFWSKMGFRLVHIASGKGKSSGRQTIAVLHSDNRNVLRVIDSLQNKLTNYLPIWLLSYCNTMAWQDVYTLTKLMKNNYELNCQDLDEIHAFAVGFRGFELTQASLQKFVLNKLMDNQTESLLEPDQMGLLIEKVLLNRPLSQISIARQISGRKQELKNIRQIIKIIK